jgi:hypothetical protein
VGPSTRSAGLVEETSVEEAKEILRKGGYLPDDAQLTVTGLILILRQFAHCSGKISKTTGDGLRAIATLLEDTQEDQAATLTARIITTLAEPIEKLTETVERLTTIATNTEQSVAQLSADRPGGAAQQDTPVVQPATARPTYVAVTQVQVPPRHAEVMARSQGHEKQVLIDRTTETNDDSFQKLTERELVVKANTTVELMGDLAADRPEGGELFIGAQKLQRGGIIYVMKSVAAANWLRQAEIKEKFMSFFGGQGRMRERGFVIVLKFVPVSLEPSSLPARRKVEEENEMEKEEIVDVKWLKDKEKRTSGQRTAFVLLTLRSARTANKILREGIVLEGKRVFAHKNTPEAKDA